MKGSNHFVTSNKGQLSKRKESTKPICDLYNETILHIFIVLDFIMIMILFLIRSYCWGGLCVMLYLALIFTILSAGKIWGFSPLFIICEWNFDHYYAVGIQFTYE